MISLDEAIKHCEEVAEEHTKYNFYGGYESCDECGKEHRQLAEWLKRLKRIEDYIADGKDDIECTYSLRFYEIEAVMNGEIWRSESE